MVAVWRWRGEGKRMKGKVPRVLGRVVEVHGGQVLVEWDEGGSYWSPQYHCYLDITDPSMYQTVGVEIKEGGPQTDRVIWLEDERGQGVGYVGDGLPRFLAHHCAALSSSTKKLPKSQLGKLMGEDRIRLELKKGWEKWEGDNPVV